MSENWDAIAAEIGLPEGWRELGSDTPEYMADPHSIYAEHEWRNGEYHRTGFLTCPYPYCSRRTRNVETMFRHVHGDHFGGAA